MDRPLDVLKPLAIGRLKQILLNSSNQLLVKQTAIDILNDGEDKKQQQPQVGRIQVFISAEHVQLLTTVAAEVKEKM